MTLLPRPLALTYQQLHALQLDSDASHHGDLQTRQLHSPMGSLNEYLPSFTIPNAVAHQTLNIPIMTEQQYTCSHKKTNMKSDK